MFKNDKLVAAIALYRINALYKMAHNDVSKKSSSTALSRRYIKIARAISRHYKVPIPRAIKNRICKNCSNVLVPGVNCKVRTASKSKSIVYKCECGAELHIYLRKRKSPGA